MIDIYLKKSLRDHVPINIIYMSSSGITQRRVKVLEINGDRVQAFCYLRKGIRVFKLNNILGAKYENRYLH